MKKILYILIVFNIIFTSCKQKENTKQVLSKFFKNREKIKFGKYDADFYVKIGSSNDTIKYSYTLKFKKTNDSVFPYHYYKEFWNKGKKTNGYLYTGDKFVNINFKDSSGIVLSKDKWKDDMKFYAFNNAGRVPVLGNRLLLKNDSILHDKYHIFKMIGVENIFDKPCYHINMILISKKDSTRVFQPINNQFDFWISKNDYTMVQISNKMDFKIKGDTSLQHQYNINIIKTYDFNGKNIEINDSLIPDYIKLKDYVPREKQVHPLKENDMAPDWTLNAINNKEYKFSNYKNQLVLIDFFYKSCVHCWTASPKILKLYNKYKDKGLNVFGIDPIDTKNIEELKKYVSEKNIKYPVLIDKEGITTSKFRIFSYPTIYLIYKGKIIYSSFDDSKNLESDLEKLISEKLK